MNDILSNEEIESLLSAVSRGDVRLTSRNSQAFAKAAEVKEYDFTRPMSVPGQSQKILDAVHEAFAGHFSSAMSLHLGLPVEARMQRFEQMSYGEFERRLPAVGTFALARVEHSDVKALLVISPKLGSALLDRLCGGQGVPAATDRQATEIEQDILDDVLAIFLEEWNTGWKAVPPASIKLEARFASAQWVRFLSGDERTVTASLEVRINETTGIVNLCYPARILQWLAERIGTPDQQHLPAPAETGEAVDVRAVVDQVPIPVEANLGTVHLRLRDVLSLNEGDVILLDKTTGESLELRVGGKVRFKGQLGSFQDKVVFGVNQKL